MRSTSFVLVGLFILGFLIALFVFFTARPVIAEYVWNKYRKGDVALTLGVKNTDTLAAIGSYYFNAAQEGGVYDPDLSLRAYQDLARIDPDFPGVYHQIGRILFVQYRLDEALTMIEKGIEYAENEDQRISALYMRGLIYGFREQPGDLARAESDFSEYTTRYPTVWGGFNDLAWVLLKQRKNQEAIEALEMYLLNNPSQENNPWILNSLGVALMNEGEFEKAEEILSRAETAAANLTEFEWQTAYSGNSPAGVDNKIDSFRASIGENLRRARTHGGA